MVPLPALWLLLAVSTHIALGSAPAVTAQSPKKTYIVQMDRSAKPPSFFDHPQWYAATVRSAVAEPEGDDGDEHEGERVIYNYQAAFHGVAARLTEEESDRLGDADGVVAIFPETKYRLHTTRSPEFLGLEPEGGGGGGGGLWSRKDPRRDVVVGVVDTGIWPESPSFNDTGLARPPPHWRGVCETGRGFGRRHCNSKIVGARIFYRGYEATAGKINEQDEYKSARDQDGHGTHTAATAAGVPVPGANLLGYASGTARGMAPGARIAAYKVCWTGGCFSSDILSAVDQAVADGVDVLSISLGGGVSSYDRDSLSVAAFGAMEMGVFVSCSAGNAGPNPVSLANVSPWITTVGASTMDRDFPAVVKLGTGAAVSGVSLYRGRRTLSTGRRYPVVYMAGNSSAANPSALCLQGTLDPRIVAGKIVVCDRGLSPRVQKGRVVKDAGGVGMILANTDANGEELVADCHLLPTAAVGESDGRLIKRYAVESPGATATLAFLGTRLGVHPAPVVAAFSSRGPNSLTLEILKPDVVAPGVNILAAWTADAGPSGLTTDRRRVKFNILSGTSMSCPHVSGVAALLMAQHPTWSPAAIKSALMTTAYAHDNSHRPMEDLATGAASTPFDHGAGHINPSQAMDPGLVYDISAQDYFEFLCTQGLTTAQLRVFSRSSSRTCRHALASPGDLNYPAISAVFPEKKTARVLTLHRVVTNVGAAVSSYRAVVTPFKGVAVKVEPRILRFTAVYQRLPYRITFTTAAPRPEPEYGSLTWEDGEHRVRSPVVVTWLSAE